LISLLYSTRDVIHIFFISTHALEILMQAMVSSSLPLVVNLNEWLLRYNYLMKYRVFVAGGKRLRLTLLNFISMFIAGNFNRCEKFHNRYENNLRLQRWILFSSERERTLLSAFDDLKEELIYSPVSCVYELVRFFVIDRFLRHTFC
jgi:hypothetical protein